MELGKTYKQRMRIYLSVCLPALPSIRPSVRPTIHPSIHLLRIHKGAMGAIASPYGVEIIFFIVVFLQKLNLYPLYLVQKQ